MNPKIETADTATPSDEQRLAELGYKQELNRTMTLTDVVVYGLIFMVPLAPVAVFGTIFNFSHGMAALVYLVAGIAMFFSAVSYKEMAKEYPVAGSVYSYVRLGTTNSWGSFRDGPSSWTTCSSRRCYAILAASAMAALCRMFPAGSGSSVLSPWWPLSISAESLLRPG